MVAQTRTSVAAIAIVAGTALVLLAMGRPPICTCGDVGLWGAVGPRQSQMIADWYSPSHVVHGLLFYAALWLVGRRWPAERRFIAAVAIEAVWEVIENMPLVIDHYRNATAALGYTGDSVVNSLSDIAMMAMGFLAARRLPIWASVLLVLALELVPLPAIRDNLTLNVWMLLAPNDAILAWQQGG